MITSFANPKVKRIRRLLVDRRFRRKEGAFVVEGTRWLNELALAGRRPLLVLASERWLEDENNHSITRRFEVTPLKATEEVLSHAGDTETSPGVLAVARIEPLPWPVSPSLLLILDRLSNPGNLGSLLRTAAAAGVDGVLLSPGCVDPYNPKVLRGGMGAQLRLPVLERDWPEIRQTTEGLNVWVAAADGATTYDTVRWVSPSALIIGAEASGAGPAAVSLAHGSVHIPMSKETESLNASVAGGIILFEAARQRRWANHINQE